MENTAQKPILTSLIHHLSWLSSLYPLINSNHDIKPANTSPDTHRAHPAIPAAHALRSSATNQSNLLTSGRVGGATALYQAKSALFPMVMNNPCSRWLWVGVRGWGVQGIQGHQPAAQGHHWAVSGPASGKDMRSWWGWRVDNGRRELTGRQSITWRGWSYTLYRASAQGCLTHILFLFFFYLLRLKESSSLTE